MTKTEARSKIKEVQTYMLNKSLVATFKRPYDNGAEATVAGVVVGNSHAEFSKNKDDIKRKVLANFSDVKFSWCEVQERKGRLEQFFSIYISYDEEPKFRKPS
jgi:hypothetical protein